MNTTQNRNSKYVVSFIDKNNKLHRFFFKKLNEAEDFALVVGSIPCKIN